jgi:hypothetical protein
MRYAALKAAYDSILNILLIYILTIPWHHTILIYESYANTSM